MPGPSEAGKSRELGERSSGENPTLFGRRVHIITKQNSCRCLQCLALAGWTVPHSAPISSTIRCQLPATEAERYAAPSGYQLSVPCQSFILAILHSHCINKLGKRADGEYFGAPKIIHCGCHLSQQRAKALPLTVHDWAYQWQMPPPQSGPPRDPI